ncbi:hypothetical protein RI367_008638 [Sorochytrium milnesiophthora]
MSFCSTRWPGGWGPVSPVADFDVTPCFAQSLLQLLPSVYVLLLGVLRLVYVWRRPPCFKVDRRMQLKLALYVFCFVTSILVLVFTAVDYGDDGSAMLAACFRVAAVMMATVLSRVEHVKYNIGSMLLTVYWLLSSVGQAISLRTYVNHGVATTSAFFAAFVLHTSLSVLLLVVEGFWKTSSDRNGDTPETHAAPLTRATFMWMAHLMHLGSKRTLLASDLYNNHPKTLTGDLYAEFAKIQQKLRNPTPLPFKAILARLWKLWILGGLCQVGALIMTFISPLVFNQLLTFVQSYGPYWPTLPQPVGYGYSFAVALLILSLLKAILEQQRMHHSIHLQIRMQSMLMNTIYRKAMRLSLSGKKGASTGEIVNHMSVDCMGLTSVFFIVQDSWSAVVTIIIALLQLWQILGVAALCGFGVLGLLTPVLGVATKLVLKQQGKKLKNMDERMKLMSEVIAGMRMIKLYATESFFINKIMDYRNTEQRALQTVFTGFSAIFGVMNAMSALIAIVSFSVYAALAKPEVPLDTTRVFMSLYYMKLVEGPMHILFGTFHMMSRAVVSYRRIAQYLGSPEIDATAVDFNRDAGAAAVAVQVVDGYFSWDDPTVQPDEQRKPADAQKPVDESTRFALTDINVDFCRGSLTAVVGRVGQGKTSLLHAILGEMVKQRGHVEINGRVAYVAQQAWIVNGTLRENILMGQPMDEQLYRRTQHACSLGPDLRILEHGDMTLIGDKGVNLSGGQKARVSLARAVYSQADILLLDDCLSAVDAHVDKHIFTHVIGKSGVLADKTVILVTHGVHHLPQCDRVVLMRNGTVAEQGTFDELMAQQGDVHALVTEYSLQEEDVADQDARTLGSRDSQDHIAEELPLVHDMSGVDAEPPLDILAHSEAAVREDDDNTTGNVDWAVYKYYLLAMGKRNLATVAVFLLMMVASDSGSQLWLGHMSAEMQTPAHRSTLFYLGIYCVFTAIFVLSNGMALFWCFVRLCLHACRVLHQRLLARVFRAPTAWFDRTPAGRILNRFSSDVDALDETIPEYFIDSLFFLVGILVAVVVIVWPLPWMLIPLAIAFAALAYVQRYFLASSREIKRLDSGAKAPIYQHFGESITGIVTIRAFGYQAQNIDRLESQINKYTRATYANYSANRWLGVSVNAIGSFIIFCVAVIGVITRNSSAGQAVGLGIVGSQNLIFFMMMLSRGLCDLEANFVAVERIKAYSNVPSEAAEHDAAVQPSWPSSGNITFDNYTTAYQSLNDDTPTQPVLRNLNLKIRGGEKIGICGRTGAGKSTITLSLFRIIEAVAGSIEIDGQDISNVGLADLRSRLTIIPQDPMLFQGTVRSNLDSLSKHSDAEVWRALEHASLKDYIATLEGGLEGKVEDGGSNFSAGQKQLLTLAAALLRKQRIVIFDEATSATDAETDAIVQRTIRSEFKDCTVLTIAHRIATIMDSDRILVLDQGQVAEFDTPQVLLQNPESAFAKLVESTKAH